MCKVVKNLEAENQQLKAMVRIAEETGVEFYELDGGGVGCSIPMTEELRDALESSVALTDKCNSKDTEIATLRNVAEAASDVSKGSTIQVVSPDWLVVSVRQSDWQRLCAVLKELEE